MATAGRSRAVYRPNGSVVKAMVLSFPPPTKPVGPPDMFDSLRADTRRLRESRSAPFPWYVLESLLVDNGYQAVVLYRIASWLRRRRVPLLGHLTARFCIFLTGVDISPNARFGPGLMISHGVGIVVGGSARAGSKTTLLHQVTLGGTRKREEMPDLGDNVFVSCGAQLLGGITVGDNVLVGANAVVTQDVPANSKVLASPRLTIKTTEPSEDGTWIS